MKRERGRPSDTAYHEAGHAVACIGFGVEITFATIIPGDGYRGMVKHVPVSHPDRLEKYHRAAIISFAGPAAQRRSHPKSSVRKSARGDSAFVNLVAEVLFEAEPMRRRFLRSAAEAREIVDRHWLAIDHVARALQARGGLSGFAVARIAQDADDMWSQVSGYRPGQSPFSFAREQAIAAQGMTPLRRSHLADAALKAAMSGEPDIAAAVLASLTSRGYAADTVIAEWTRAKEALAS